jgi:hypothetical protein
MNDTLSGASQVDQPVRPRAWLREPKVQRHVGRHLVRGVSVAEPTAEEREFAELDGDQLIPLYDQAAIDAALNLWPRDCRLCAHFTTATGGCVSVIQCVDSMQFKATAPRQCWTLGPNVGVEQHAPQ